MRLVALLAVISAFIPRVAHACSPGPMSVRVFWPEDGVLPANGSVWLIRSGVAHPTQTNWMPSVQFKTDNGSPITTTIVKRPVDLEQRYTLSHHMLIRVDAHLEPQRSYTLEYSSSSTVTSQFQITTTELDTAVPSPPEAIELMFSDTNEPPAVVSSCSPQKANEVSVVFLRPNEGTSWILGSATWPDGSQTERSRLLLVPNLDHQIIFTFWGADLGVPCARFVAVGPGGVESAPVEVCQASACGDRDAFNWSYQKWNQSGGPCEDSNTGCSSVRGATSSGLARAILGLLRRVSSH